MSAWVLQFSVRGIAVEARAFLDMGLIEARRRAARMAQPVASSRKLAKRNGESSRRHIHRCERASGNGISELMQCLEE